MALRVAQVAQWQEYSQCQLSRCASERDVADRLKELDSYLEKRVYFVGNEESEADVSIFQSLNNTMTNLGFPEKETYRNVSRWFNHIQNTTLVNNSSVPIVFLKSPIYLPAQV
ncbi:eukaryotic translation elongation factor 1 epsilon-1-like [Haliotis rubra]|uniref:eukaryotic translation elongation factor 1 epsilon-1-like n=1 Tax=Haliotis rubra TaxID=36100 RepID=UPI001EE54264|nr:eukaryotic translation elongation factor 1 epsilon-1-like [Haliotis rubra]XP_046565829.1 eukaryotic translation elongation factor 1 epsilon-1-like [Haliotis rubra]XP_046565830.1 eukaryotic translation elongation factor 1 epsilon-1-like [Haliotis rubra]XP_046565831.1 eukaryotic translation elongation factor 1 epsilon-1-like [Haliotis rubra]